MPDTINPSIGVQNGNTTVRVDAEIGAPANPTPGQTGTQLNSITPSVTVINGDNTATTVGVKIGTDPTNPSIGVNFQFGQRQDGMQVPYETQSTFNGQPVSLPGFTTVYPQPSSGTTVGAGANVFKEPTILQTPTPDNPNAQFQAVQPQVGLGAAVNLQTGDAAVNLVGGARIIAPSNDQTQLPGANLGASLQVGGNGVTLNPTATVMGAEPSPMDAAFDSVRFRNPQPQPGNDATNANPQTALDALRRSPEYDQAIKGLQQGGVNRDVAPDSSTDRLGVGIALDAQRRGVPVSGVDFGNPIINAQGNSDRNVFYGGQGNSELRISESQALNTPALEQVAKAQAQTAPAPQVANPQLETQTQEPKARSMQ
jgi:hypothetical protein